jgi:hypothetical protein
LELMRHRDHDRDTNYRMTTRELVAGRWLTVCAMLVAAPLWCGVVARVRFKEGSK